MIKTRHEHIYTGVKILYTNECVPMRRKLPHCSEVIFQGLHPYNAREIADEDPHHLTPWVSRSRAQLLCSASSPSMAQSKYTTLESMRRVKGLLLPLASFQPLGWPTFMVGSNSGHSWGEQEGVDSPSPIQGTTHLQSEVRWLCQSYLGRIHIILPEVPSVPHVLHLSVVVGPGGREHDSPMTPHRLRWSCGSGYAKRWTGTFSPTPHFGPPSHCWPERGVLCGARKWASFRVGPLSVVPCEVRVSLITIFASCAICFINAAAGSLWFSCCW